MTPPNSSPVNEGSKKRRISRSTLVPVEVHVEDDRVPLFEIDDPTYLTPKSSRPNRNVRSSGSSNDQSADASPSRSNRSVMDVGRKTRPQSFRKDHALPMVPENKVGQRRSKKVLESPKDLPQPPRSFNSQRRRHQSVPATSVSRTGAVNDRDALPQARGHVLQELSNNAILLKEFASFKKTVLERLPAATPRTQSDHVRPADAPTAAVVTENEDEQPRPRKKKGRSDPEWQRQHPKLDKNVPRTPDEEVIRIGKIKNAYERHVQAPCAFSRRGRLYKGPDGYKHLLTQIDENGSTVWDFEEVTRIGG